MHPFSTHKNIRKPYSFLMFSGSKERVEQIGQWNDIYA